VVPRALPAMSRVSVASEVVTTYNAHTGPTQRSHNAGSKIETP
jgi:hypothetical protein